jgi:hypothetical protein
VRPEVQILSPRPLPEISRPSARESAAVLLVAVAAQALLVWRKYRRQGDAWLLAKERHRVCFDDRAWDRTRDDPINLVTVEGPCWPPPAHEDEPEAPKLELVQ